MVGWCSMGTFNDPCQSPGFLVGDPIQDANWCSAGPSPWRAPRSRHGEAPPRARPSGDHRGYACDLWQGVWCKCHVWVLVFFFFGTCNVTSCLTRYNFKKTGWSWRYCVFFNYGDVSQISWDLLGPIQLWFYQVVFIYIYICLVGGFNPSEKYESQLGWFFPIYGKIKNVPNLQPDIYIYNIRV